MVSIEEMNPHQLVAIEDITAQLNLQTHEVDLYGRYKAKIKLSVAGDTVSFREKQKQKCFYVCVSATTPTPLGEGKTTTCVGLTQCLSKHLDQMSIATLRQPSLGPTFGMKGGGGGGGMSSIIPSHELDVHLTGDIHAVTSAQNLICAALDSRMYHEGRLNDKSLFEKMVSKNNHGTYKYTEAQLRRFGKLQINPSDVPSNDGHTRRFVRLNVDESRVNVKRSVDMNDRTLSHVLVQSSGNVCEDAVESRNISFTLTAASELMSILSLSSSMSELLSSIRQMTVAWSKDGQPITCDDLCVSDAVLLILNNALCPTLMQTSENAPVIVHTGAFANISHGNSSIIGDIIACKLVGSKGFVLTEAGFGSDVGFEKFVHIKCRRSGFVPNCVVVVTSVRAIHHLQMDKNDESHVSVQNSDLEAAAPDGLENLKKHILICRSFGVIVVVAINYMTGDSDNDHRIISDKSLSAGAFQCVVVDPFYSGGKGCIALGRSVIDICHKTRVMLESTWKFLYDDTTSIKNKIEIICQNVYGATKCTFSATAQQFIDVADKTGTKSFPVCIAKTPYSFTANAKLKGCPKDFTVHIECVSIHTGSRMVVATCGSISVMPGLPIRPRFFDMLYDKESDSFKGV